MVQPQAISYLVVTGCSVARLLNLGVRSLEGRRVFPPRQVSGHVNRQGLCVADWLAQAAP